SDVAKFPFHLHESKLFYVEKVPQLNERVRYLSSKKCVADLKGYLRKIEAFSPQSILIGDYEYNAEFMLRRYKAYEKKSIFQRFQLIAEDIFENLRTRPFQPKRKPTKYQQVNRLKKMFHVLKRSFPSRRFSD
ncbi:hypothetical protein EI033_25045, partial [Escherichia coli]